MNGKLALWQLVRKYNV